MRRSTRCPRWSPPSTAGCRCCSTPACAADADAFQALALGAAAVLIGRAYVWGLAVAGQAGVREVLENLRAELDLTMALAGCASLAEVGPGTLRDVG